MTLDRYSGSAIDQVRKYQKNPTRWLEDVFGVKLWGKQEEIFKAAWQNRYTAVKSCYASGKCVDLEEDILLSGGQWIKAGKLVGQNFRVPSFDAETGKLVQASARAEYNGTKPVYKIVTSYGEEIVRTGNHPLYVGHFKQERNKATNWNWRYQWKDASWVDVEDLSIDDEILVPVEHGIAPEGLDITDEEIKILAYLVADGGMTTGTTTFSKQDEKVLTDFKDAVNSVGDRCRELAGGKDGCSVYSESFGPSTVLEFTRDWGIRTKSINKSLPDKFYRLSNDQLALFLNRYFDCDGWVYMQERQTVKQGYRAEIGAATGSKSLARSIKRALYRFGIRAKLRFKPSKLEGETFDSWVVQIDKKQDILRFADQIGLFSKEDKLKECVEHTKSQKDWHDYRRDEAPQGFVWAKISKIEYVGDRPTVTVSVDDTHTFITEVVEHNSFLSACLAISFVHLLPNSIAVTTAPTQRQLKNIWGPVHELYDKAKADLGSELLSHEIRCGPQHYAIGFTTNMPDRLQGIHAENVMIIEDESAGIEAEIHSRLTDALMTSESARFLAIGNPLSPEGHFYEMFQENSNFETHSITAFDTPNVTEGEEIIPGLVTDIWVQEQREKYGEDSPHWKSQVLAQFPASSEEMLVPYAWIRAAQQRWLDAEPDGKEVQGFDPSGGGQDEAALCTRAGTFVYECKGWGGLDSTELVNTVTQYVNPNGKLYIDEVGVGWGVKGSISNKGFYVVGVKGQSSPSDDDRFRNLRAELYWKVREAFNPKSPTPLSIPPNDEVLAKQLMALRYVIDTKGRIQIESKKKLKKRGIGSPNRADALALTMMDSLYEGAMPISVGVSSSGSDPFGGLKQESTFGYTTWDEYRH